MQLSLNNSLRRRSPPATSVETGAAIKATTAEKGDSSLPSILAGSYSVTVSKPGFKTETKTGINVNAGLTLTVNVKLEIGQATETVVVSAGAEIVQSTTAEVSTTITTQQIENLPFATRNSVELLVTQPGTQTPTNPRSSTINGLPKGALNITIDGQKTEDNMLKSSDGFFSYIVPSIDAIEEVRTHNFPEDRDFRGIRFQKAAPIHWAAGQRQAQANRNPVARNANAQSLSTLLARAALRAIA